MDNQEIADSISTEYKMEPLELQEPEIGTIKESGRNFTVQQIIPFTGDKELWKYEAILSTSETPA